MGNLYSQPKQQIKTQVAELTHPTNTNPILQQQPLSTSPEIHEQILDCPPFIQPQSTPSQSQAAQQSQIQIQLEEELQIKQPSESSNPPKMQEQYYIKLTSEFSPLRQKSEQSLIKQPNESQNLLKPQLLQVISLNSSSRLMLQTSQRSERTVSIDNTYTHDPSDFKVILRKLIASYFPIEEGKKIKLLQRKRTLILWLKQNEDSQKERQRDVVIRNQGYQLYTTHQITKIFQKYAQLSSVSLRKKIVLLFSYSSSHFYDNQASIKQLYDQLIQTGKISKLHIVKPHLQENYQKYAENGKRQLNIVQYPYQIEFIRLKINEMECQPLCQSINIAPLTYWDQETGLIELLKDQPLIVSNSLKMKISVCTILVAGKSMLFKTGGDKEFIKRFLYSYNSLINFYFARTPFGTVQNTSQIFVEKISMKLMEDPLSFYCQPPNEILINRMIKYCGDEPSYLTNIALPITMIQNKIKEQYRKNRKSKKYADEFICYYETFLNEEELMLLTTKTVFQNVGFIKANINPIAGNDHDTSLKINTLIQINVTNKNRNEEYDKGYSFISPSNQANTGKGYFSGFKYVLFNILNSFMVLNHQYDIHRGKHIIQLQYGYIASQVQFKITENTIAEDGVYLTRKKLRAEQQLDQTTVIKIESNKKVIEKIQDYGDGVSLFGYYNDAIRYYEQLFKRHKTEMDQIGLVFAHLQMKKAKNYELSNNIQTSLQNYYSAFNYLHKGNLCIEIQDIYIKVMKTLYKSGSYDKAIRYGGNIIKNAKAQKNLQFYQPQFLLQLYTILAENYQQRATINFQIKHQQISIMEYYQKALQIVDQIGEYNELVPPFYISLGRYLLMARKQVQSLIYLNKSLLLKKTILRWIHHDLCPIYQLLSVAYVSVHDYHQALKAVENCILIYQAYYPSHNYRFTAPLELQAKIYALMNNFPKSLQIFKKEVRLLIQLSKTQRIKQNQQRKGRFTSDSIGLFNAIEQKHLNPYINGYFKQTRSQICLVYVYIYIGWIEKVRYRFTEASQYLNIAYKLNCQQLGQIHRLNILIFMKLAQIQISCCNWSNALEILNNCWNVINKVKKQTSLEGAQYYELKGRLYEKKGDLQNSLTNYNKEKQLKFKFYGRQHLQTCKANDNLGKINIKSNNLSQAKNFFDQSEKIRKHMLERAVEDPKSTGMFGLDLEDFINCIRLSLCTSLQNSGLLLFTLSQFNESLTKYQKALTETINLIGEYHPKTADIYMQLGKVYHGLGGQYINQSLASLTRSLSIYKSLVNYNRQSEIEVYCLLALVQEARNQPAVALQQLKQSIIIMRNINLLWVRFDEAIHNFSRLTDLIVAHANISHLKIGYYTITKLFAEQRETKIGQVVTKYRPQINETILQIISKLSVIRSIIDQHQGVNQPEDAQHKIQMMVVKSGNLNLESIKDKMLFQRQRRQRNKYPDHSKQKSTSQTN